MLLSHGHSVAVRALVIGTGALLTVAVGVTRVLLAAHFPTDIVAGWLVGGLLGLCAWAVVVRLAGDPARGERPARGGAPEVASSRQAQRAPRVEEDA